MYKVLGCCPDYKICTLLGMQHLFLGDHFQSSLSLSPTLSTPSSFSPRTQSSSLIQKSTSSPDSYSPIRVHPDQLSSLRKSLLSPFSPLTYLKPLGTSISSHPHCVLVRITLADPWDWHPALTTCFTLHLGLTWGQWMFWVPSWCRCLFCCIGWIVVCSQFWSGRGWVPLMVLGRTPITAY